MAWHGGRGRWLDMEGGGMEVCQRRPRSNSNNTAKPLVLPNSNKLHGKLVQLKLQDVLSRGLCGALRRTTPPPPHISHLNVITKRQPCHALVCAISLAGECVGGSRPRRRPHVQPDCQRVRWDSISEDFITADAHLSSLNGFY